MASLEHLKRDIRHRVQSVCDHNGFPAGETVSKSYSRVSQGSQGIPPPNHEKGEGEINL